MSGHGGSGHFVLENVGILKECVRQFCSWDKVLVF
jgi:hypothetical protein